MRHRSLHGERKKGKKTTKISNRSLGEMRLILFCFQLKSCYLDGCAGFFFLWWKLNFSNWINFETLRRRCRIMSMNMESFVIKSNPDWIYQIGTIYIEKKENHWNIDKCEIILQFSHFFHRFYHIHHCSSAFTR